MMRIDLVMRGNDMAEISTLEELLKFPNYWQGGVKCEVAQFLAQLKTQEEMMEYLGAFLQLYREQGWYLESTVHFVGRIGVDHVKAAIVDSSVRRKGLYARLLYALQGAPEPLQQTREARVDTREFAMLSLYGCAA